MTIGLEGATPQILAHFAGGATTTASAEFIDANTLATAAHAISRNGVIASSVDLIVDGVTIPIDVSTIRANVIFSGTSGPTSAQAVADDYATFSTGDKALGLTAGVFTLDKDNSFKSGDVTISGYPVTDRSVLIQPYGQMTGRVQDATFTTDLSGVSPGLVDGLSGGAVAAPFADPGGINPFVVGKLVGIVATGSADGKTGTAVDTQSSTVDALVKAASADDAQVVAAVKAAALAEAAHRIAPNFEADFFQKQVADLSKGGTIAATAAAAITTEINNALDTYVPPSATTAFVLSFGDQVLHLQIGLEDAQRIGAQMAASPQAEHDITQLGANFLINGVVDLVGVNTVSST